jgi:hypothetical protein
MSLILRSAGGHLPPERRDCARRAAQLDRLGRPSQRCHHPGKRQRLRRRTDVDGFGAQDAVYELVR